MVIQQSGLDFLKSRHTEGKSPFCDAGEYVLEEL